MVTLVRHARGGGHLRESLKLRGDFWIPAFTGMTVVGQSHRLLVLLRLFGEPLRLCAGLIHACNDRVHVL